MKKDIFIDTNIACRFANPMDPHMRELVEWLKVNDTSNRGRNRAYWVVSNKLLGEYYASNKGANKQTSLYAIISKLQKEGRLIFIKNKQITAFMDAKFTKRIVKHLLSNRKDWNHIPVVLLSSRKYALTNDANFAADLKQFPGYNVTVSNRPEQIPYKV